MSDILTSRQDLVLINYGESLIRKQSLHWSDPTQLFLKRCFDLLFSALIIVLVLSWVVPLFAVLIKSTSKGPVLFKQLRHGRNNVPFYCYKFRTMRINDAADIQQAVKNDPRVTKVGAFLRRTSLDELPQIINVIKGEMSIVGPRPHAVLMNERFSEGIDNFMFRHSVKPGITGLAQSKGLRGETKEFFDIYSRCKLDLFYIKNWSIVLDLKIIGWTTFVVLFKNKQVY